WNHQVRGGLEAVGFEIWHSLMERTGRQEEIAGYFSKPAPSPQPPDGGEGVRRPRDRPHTIAAFTQWIGGSASNRHSHFSPPSRPIQSCPVVVPKKRAGDCRSSMSIASPSTVQ